MDANLRLCIASFQVHTKPVKVCLRTPLFDVKECRLFQFAFQRPYVVLRVVILFIVCSAHREESFVFFAEADELLERCVPRGRACPGRVCVRVCRMLPFHVLRALHEVMNSLVEPDIDCDISILVVWIDHVLIIVWQFALKCLLLV